MNENRVKLAVFFSGEYRRMTSFVRRIIDDTADYDGEDIVQDVITGIFEAADITRPIENMAAYVYRSLRNRVIDIIRGRKTTLSLNAVNPDTGTALGDLLEDIRYDTEGEFFIQALREELFASIEKLPEDQKAIVIMTEFEGMSYRSISEKTGVPVGTLLSRKSRALDSIRAEMNKYRYLMEE